MSDRRSSTGRFRSTGDFAVGVGPEKVTDCGADRGRSGGDSRVAKNSPWRAGRYRCRSSLGLSETLELEGVP